MYLSKESVVPVLREEYNKWIKELTLEEKKAIRKYSYNSLDSRPNRFFKRSNAMLRGEYNKSDIEILKKYAKVISKAIHRHRLEHDIICYRCVDVDPTKDLIEGTEFTFDQFISTSVIKSKTLRGRYNFIIYAPVGTLGAYIEKISVFPNQREFLLDSSCIYKLLSRKGNVIELEVKT
ncbi:MAG: hypothetical protein IJP31_01830 [Lachnospiraceae bacterium]|nr:hypothetical protein [Lachnospiraceae bacterium]